MKFCSSADAERMLSQREDVTEGCEGAERGC